VATSETLAYSRAAVPDVVIENPVINSPYEDPGPHFVFADDGITDQIADSRRLSSYFTASRISSANCGR